MGTGPPGPGPPYFTLPSASAPAASPAAAERPALVRVKWAGLLVVLVGILGIGPSFLSFGISGGRLMVTGWVFVYTLVAGGLQMVVLALLWSGFRRLRPLDPGRFETPVKLGPLAPIGLAVVLSSLYPLLAVATGTLGCLGGPAVLNNTTSGLATCGSDLAVIGGLALVLLVGGILALIGFVALLIGVWRLGARYGGSLFQVGAILMIFPLLNIVAGILIYLAARGAISSTARSTRFGPR